MPSSFVLDFGANLKNKLDSSLTYNKTIVGGTFTMNFATVFSGERKIFLIVSDKTKTCTFGITVTEP